MQPTLESSPSKHFSLTIKYGVPGIRGRQADSSESLLSIVLYDFTDQIVNYYGSIEILN
jgi:hypothetical protein